MKNDIKLFGLKETFISLIFYNNLATAIKRILICNRKGHDYWDVECLRCWQVLPLCDECGIHHIND